MVGAHRSIQFWVCLTLLFYKLWSSVALYQSSSSLASLSSTITGYKVYLVRYGRDDPPWSHIHVFRAGFLLVYSRHQLKPVVCFKTSQFLRIKKQLRFMYRSSASSANFTAKHAYWILLRFHSALVIMREHYQIDLEVPLFLWWNNIHTTYWLPVPLSTFQRPFKRWTLDISRLVSRFFRFSTASSSAEAGEQNLWADHVLLFRERVPPCLSVCVKWETTLERPKKDLSSIWVVGFLDLRVAAVVALESSYRPVWVWDHSKLKF